jgi:hypothetical protein
MGNKIFGRVFASAKLMAAVTGVGAAIAMGAVSITHESAAASASAARSDNPPLVATVTRSTAPKELATSFARPTHTAKLCAARATMPC